MQSMIKAKSATAEEITEQLSDAVHEHRLKPGAKLREDEVSDVFGVSRTVVRQALQAMAFEGLLTIEKNRGAFVSKPTLKEAHEVFQAQHGAGRSRAHDPGGHCLA